jgi:ABC-type polysaccharide/polyol phosphate transport system ATPase subunit
MNSGGIAIEVEGLSKHYKLFDKPSGRIWYYLFKTGSPRDFTALENCSFTVQKGETFGIIGKNGSGKSTVLQLLAGIIQPTGGNLRINGKVAALLELGSGFNPESTGIENIYINAAILGIGRKEAESKLDDIINFADIGEFISQPVKTYSSGMYVRLAFAIAINVDADILLIDEALAVGDIFFRQKCYAKLNRLKEQGKTIILVTHGMGEVEQFCDRALLLSKGRQIMLGRSQDVVKQYYLINQEESALPPANSGEHEVAVDGDGAASAENFVIREHVYFDLSQSVEISNGKARFVKAGLFNEDGMAARVFQQGEDAYFYFKFEVLEDIATPIIGVMMYDQRNTIIYGKNSAQTYAWVPSAAKKGQILTCYQKVTLNIAIGEVTFEMGISDMTPTAYNNRDVLPNEEFFANERRMCHRNNVGSFTIITKKTGTPTRLTHHGVCDLPTEIIITM